MNLMTYDRQTAASKHPAAPADLTSAARPAGPSPSGGFWTLPGFCRNARVATSFGELPIEALRLRDPLRTASGGFAQVAWIDEIKLDEGFLDGFPDAQPVAIAAGALGNGRPKSAISVSPHQRLAVGDARYAPEQRMARDLLDHPGVMRRPESLVRYFVFHCGRPVTVMVEGVWVNIAP